MKLQQLKYVVKVAEVGNITEASRRLFVSQPSITAAIRDLEREVGVVIFERTNKGVVVTSEGETFLGYARQVLEQADLLEEKYKGETQQVPTSPSPANIIRSPSTRLSTSYASLTPSATISPYARSRRTRSSRMSHA